MSQQLAARRRKTKAPPVRGLSLPTPRLISFEKAKARFVNRFTMEHIPPWAEMPHATATGTPEERATKGPFYAPQYRTDQEWYDNTAFPGEDDELAPRGAKHCYSINQSYPLGLTLQKRFVRP